jgi:hypothetical protein
MSQKIEFDEIIFKKVILVPLKILSYFTCAFGILIIVNHHSKFLRDLSLMVGCSFDGTSNMRSDSLELQGRLKELNNDIPYTWDYAHVLNLVVTECAESALSARNLFALLQTTHSFMGMGKIDH